MGDWHAGQLEGARKKTLRDQPEEVQLAVRADAAPGGDRWLHEIKLDGYRMICRIRDGRVRFFSRNGRDWTDRLPSVARAAGQLDVLEAVLDGEIVVMAADGTTSFQTLQNALGKSSGEIQYYVFDLLHLDGFDLHNVALEERKKLLSQVLAARSDPDTRICLCDHIVGNGATVVEQAAKLGVEGIICKRRDRPYRAGRADTWLKVKFFQREEFVVGGFTEPNASRSGLGALVVGYFDPSGRFCYAGRVGTGFTEQMLVELRRRLQAERVEQCPFESLPDDFPLRGAHWVEPTLVAQVEYGNWTGEGHLRHPSFQGLREDRAAEEVVLERPTTVTPLPGTVSSESTKKATRKSAKKSTKPSSEGAISQVADAAGGGPQPSPEPPAEDAGGQSSRQSRRRLESLRMTNPDRIVYPTLGVTKLGLASHYANAAAWMLPHVVNRPLTLVRGPKGVEDKLFFQRHRLRGMPAAVEGVEVEEDGESVSYLVVRDLAGVLGLIQFGVLEIHCWNARADRLDRPDRMIFDLDPDDAVSWREIVAAAGEVRDVLTDLGLTAWVKTSGGKGVHVVLPLSRRNSWEEITHFSKQVAARLAREQPQRFVDQASKAARRGRIYLDVARNVRGATTVAAYSSRARPDGGISVPVDWDELPGLRGGNHFTLENFARRLATHPDDCWADLAQHRQSLTAAMRRAL